jgi:hypothetical protein
VHLSVYVWHDVVVAAVARCGGGSDAAWWWRWRDMVVAAARRGGGGGDAAWWCGGGGGASGGGLGAAAGGGGGARVAAWPAGLAFFCFSKIPSPRALWASRHMSAERGPACSRRRPLRRWSGCREAITESFLSVKASPRGNMLSARVPSLSAKGLNPVVNR